MVLKALMELSGQRSIIEETLKNEQLHGHEDHQHQMHSCPYRDDNVADYHGSTNQDFYRPHHHNHGRSWYKVREIINDSSFSDSVKAIAISIYKNIAEAEANVHGETLETIHFHEVGRDEAIKNALGIGMALDAIKLGVRGDKEDDGREFEILTSSIYDGKGTIVCSHGEIPVPVPAVQALMKKCSYDFRTADVDTEMVTPSGLASLMGIGAKPSAKTLRQLLEKQQDPAGAGDQSLDSYNASVGSSSPEIQVKIIAKAEAKGSRDTGRGGLRVYLIEVDMTPDVVDRVID